MNRWNVAAFALFLCVSWTSALYAQDTQENAEFKLAVGLYNEGLYEPAADQFRIFIEKFPNTSLGIEARYYMGLLHLKQERFADARNIFQDFALRYSDNPKAPEAWWHTGECFEAMRNYAEAASAFSRIKTFYPKNAKAPDALIAASRNFLKAGDIDNAKLVLNAIVIEYAQSTAVQDAKFSLGKIYTAEGEYQKAQAEFRRLIASPDAPAELKARAMTGRGEVLDLMGERAESELAFQEVITSYPTLQAADEAAVRLGDVQRKQGKCTQAAVQYEKVMKNTAAEKDIRQEAYSGAAKCAMQAGDYSKAASVYADMFRTFQGSVIAENFYRSAAEAARKAGRYTDALTYLETVYRDTVQHVNKGEVLALMARIATEGGNYNEAVQRYREYIASYPRAAGTPYAMLELAGVYGERFGNHSQAIEMYTSVAESFASSPVADDAQFRKGQGLEASENYSRAKEAYTQLLGQFPASEYYDEALRHLDALNWFKSGNTEDALERLTYTLSALNAQQSSAEVQYMLGVIYLDDLKKYDEAIRHFSDAEGKGLAGEHAAHAAYGKAMAALRLYQAGSGSRDEAERQLQAFVVQYRQSADFEGAAYELWMLQSEGDNVANALQACEEYLASGAAQHSAEVRIARSRALDATGRSEEANKELTALLAGNGAENAEAYYWRGMLRMQHNDVQGAANDFDSYINKAKSGRYSAKALMAMGRMYAQTGEYSKSVQAYESVSRMYGYASLKNDADLALLNALADGGMLDRAVYKSREMWNAVSANPFLEDQVVAPYLYQYAVVLAKARDAAGAKKALQEYLERYPDGRNVPDVYFALGQMYKDEGKIALATQYLQKAGAQGKNAQAGRAAADLMMENGNYIAAVRAYRALAESEQTQMGKTYALSRMIVALYRADSLQTASSAAEDFHTQYPDAESVLREFILEQGKYYYRKSDYKSAEKYFEDAADADNKDIRSLGYFWIGKTYEARNQNEDAKEAFDDVINDYPGTQGALESMLAMGKMNFRAENYPDAALYYKNVVDVPNLPDAQMKEALNGLIACYDFMQYYDAAIEMTKRFLAAYPNDPTAFRKKVNMGQFYYQLRYYDQAVTHFQSLLGEATPDDQAEIRYYIGECYYYKGDFTQAALEFLKVPYLVVKRTEIDWRASAYYMAGQSYEKQTKYNLAMEMYNKILTLKEVDARFVAQARKEIDRVQKLIE